MKLKKVYSEVAYNQATQCYDVSTLKVLFVSNDGTEKLFEVQMPWGERNISETAEVLRHLAHKLEVSITCP